MSEVETKYCPKCQQIKLVDCFYRAPSRKDGRRTYCIQCTSDIKKKHDNPSVYKITNVINGKVYVGQSWDTRKRWGDHRDQVGLNSSCYIHRAMRKYGIDSFKFQILAVPDSQEVMDELEEYFIRLFDSTNPKKGYNLRTGGAGWRPNEETRKKMSEVQLLRTQAPGYVHPMQGKTHTPEVRKAQSERMTGVPRPDISARQKQLVSERGREYYVEMSKKAHAARWGVQN